MADEIIVPACVEPIVQTTSEGVTQPTPTPVQEHVADDVFTKEQEQAAAALLGVQMGLGLVHTLAAEYTAPTQPEQPPRRKPEEKETE